MSGGTSRRRHGLAGLLVALFVVAGLVFSYGLGHAPPARVCTEHAVTVPVDAALAHQGPHGALPKIADASIGAPPAVPPQGPVDACLCLAVLFTLMVLVLLAAGRGRPVPRLPARSCWAALLPRGGLPAFLSPACSQVLRL